MATAPKQLVIISGKGGTGKTSIVASFAALADGVVLADCDVDAADLHLLLEPKIVRREEFSGGRRARVVPELCVACGKCRELCRFDAVFFDGPPNGAVDKTYRVDPIACEGCGVCAHFCPAKAIEFNPAVNGDWFVSDTRLGPMVHAKLGVAQENSGKLVTVVRTEARRIAEQRQDGLVLIDGAPGIGCPVIASLTGADMALVVTEPTLSALHDLQRVVELTGHFGICTAVCVNKCDLNPELTTRIERHAAEGGLALLGKVRYDRDVTVAQMRQLSVVEYKADGCCRDIAALWAKVADRLGQNAPGATQMPDKARTQEAVDRARRGL